MVTMTKTILRERISWLKRPYKRKKKQNQKNSNRAGGGLRLSESSLAHHSLCWGQMQQFPSAWGHHQQQAPSTWADPVGCRTHGLTLRCVLLVFLPTSSSLTDSREQCWHLQSRSGHNSSGSRTYLRGPVFPEVTPMTVREGFVPMCLGVSYKSVFRNQQEFVSVF